MTHIAGFAVILDGRFQRQICAWCGEILIDNDLSKMASTDGRAPAFWECGCIVEVDGNCSSKLDVDRLPDNSCAIMEITR